MYNKDKGMQNVINGITHTVETVEQINSVGVTTSAVSIMVAVLGVISFLVSLYMLFRKIDKKIDARIDARIKPSIRLLEETVGVVKNLEKNIAEMNATLTILKEILLAHKNS